MRRAIALVAATLPLAGCGLIGADAPVLRTVDYSLRLSGDGGLFGLQIRHTGSDGKSVEQTISLPAWEARITIEAGPAQLVELGGQGELRSFVGSGADVVKPSLPDVTCTIHIDGRKVAEQTGRGVLCQAMVDE